MLPAGLPPARLAGAAGVLAAVLLLHALLLGGWPPPPALAPRPRPAGRAPPVQLRVTVATAPPGASRSEPQAGVAAPVPAMPAMPAARTPGARAGRTSAPAATTTPAPARPAASAAAPPADAAAVAAPATARAVAQADPATPDDAPATPAAALAGVTVPTYPTVLPPAFALSYQVRRPGAQRRGGGTVQLAWQPEGDRYTLSLGHPGQGSTSTGTLDALGVAPERQADTRRAREVRAVNFQRDSGRITYSGPQVEHPLLPGAQDRLSWLVQLAGVLAADPALAAPGRSVQLYVTGPRGDAAVWTFVVAGPDAVELPDGTRAAALRLLREPQGAWDTRVELWVDPARHHLPLRLRLQQRQAAEATEFLLATATPPP